MASLILNLCAAINMDVSRRLITVSTETKHRVTKAEKMTRICWKSHLVTLPDVE